LDGLLAKRCKQEFYVAAGNPKAILIFTALFPQFVDRMHSTSSFTTLGATFLSLELVAIAFDAVVGARLRWLTVNPRRLVWLNRGSGSLMVAFGVLLTMLRRLVA
jgi:threonine/homoserine/homoserine lactone efflux protein